MWAGWEAPEETPYLFQLLEVPPVLGSRPLPPASYPPVLHLSDPSLFRELFVCLFVCIFVCCFQVGFFFLFVFCFFGLSYGTWDLTIPSQGLNLGPLQWKSRVLTSGPPWMTLSGSSSVVTAPSHPSMVESLLLKMHEIIWGPPG